MLRWRKHRGSIPCKVTKGGPQNDQAHRNSIPCRPAGAEFYRCLQGAFWSASIGSYCADELQLGRTDAALGRAFKEYAGDAEDDYDEDYDGSCGTIA